MVGVILRGSNEARNETRSHVRQIRGNWIGEREFRFAAAKQLGLPLCQERPGHRLEHAARGERALGLAGAQLNGREHRFARGLAAIEGRRGNTVDPENTDDLLGQIGLALHVSAPRGDGHFKVLACIADCKPQPAEHAFDLAPIDLQAGEPRKFVERKVDHARRHFWRARDRDFGRCPAA